MSAKFIDWDVIQDSDVLSVLDKAAAAIARQFKGYVEADDAWQEGAIILAHRAHRVNQQVAGERINELYHELHMDLINLYKRESGKRAQVVSTDGMEL